MVGSAMWVLAAFCCLTVAVDVVTGATAGCNLTLDGETFRRETILSDVLWPAHFAVDYTRNILYFNYNNSIEWVSASLNLQNKAYSDIEELPAWCWFTVDQVRQQVHAGCRDGLYQLDTNVGRFELAGEAKQIILFVHYDKDMLYYSPYPSHLLHTLRNGRSDRVHDVPGQVFGLAVGRRKDWIFYNSTGVYRQRAGSGAAGATRYEGIVEPREVAVDRSRTAYVCDISPTKSGIYRLSERTSGATRLLNEPCGALIIDRDNNIIYGDHNNDRIVRLVKC